ncbi:protein translocase subunit SecF [Egibacter rhizosphaerae]|uniref:protein translocase subunit SecF n=1 Tax=Egibacter rhizosphaerae TaxID=1670831 RepID=UPI0013F15338|nr:protein translocase subunit SecF [Egibacter rhizosphaerae]
MTATVGADHGGKDTRLRRFLNGEAGFEIVPHGRRWGAVSLVLILLALGAVGIRGLDFSIEFTGGTTFIVENAGGGFTSDELRDALTEELGVEDLTAQVVDGGEGARVSTPELGEPGGERELAAVDTIAEVTGADPGDIARDSVGPTWGESVTEAALFALAVFLALVVVYISLRFELRMAVAALVTLLHDIVVTVGVYALVGFEVSPASVIALLTILGYSLYDTVVVFDRIGEDAKQIGPDSSVTYSEVANESLNKVLVRSLSTSITSLLPTGALLFIGAQLFGADTLQDLALALFIGMGVGTYSSIFVATPILAWLKERAGPPAEPEEEPVPRGVGPARADGL